MNRTLVLVAIVISTMVVSGRGADWPQWRGPNRDGVWPEDGIVERFAQRQLPIRWRAKIGSGYSGPTVADRRVYVTDRVAVPKQLERVHCFDSIRGEKLWSHQYKCDYEQVAKRDGPRASVTIDDGRAYSLGTMGDLHCFDAATGNILWKKELKTEYKIKLPVWGIAAALLVEDDLVIVHVGGEDGACLIAFDRADGRQIWKTLDDDASYAAPIVIEQAGKRVLVCLTGQRVVGLNPLGGKLYWQIPFEPVKMVHHIASPVFKNGRLFVSSFFDGSLLAEVHPDELTVKELWRRRGNSERNTDALHCCISTPVIDGDHIYGVDAYGQLRCLDLHTGDRIWESLNVVPANRWATAHLIRNKDKMWMFNELGELIISELSPKGFEEISRAKLIEPTKGQLERGVCWSHPAFAYRHVYARNDEEIVCADLSARD
ncbi:MAG: PQQ-binding-like beta-propeller repeat protein [Planctomycetota bacterium]|jgi:outer membrane protein assembly factor BamB